MKLNVLKNFNALSALGTMLIVALVCFEMFNYSTTQFSLGSIFRNEVFLGMGWATWLAVAACLVDIAGLARMFTPEHGRKEPMEIWLITGAWLLSAVLNAVATWWAVVLVMVSQNIGNEVVGRAALVAWVPALIAVTVWLIRMSLIGGLVTAGEKFLFGDRKPEMPAKPAMKPISRPMPALSTSKGYNPMRKNDPVPANGKLFSGLDALMDEGLD